MSVMRCGGDFEPKPKSSINATTNAVVVSEREVNELGGVYPIRQLYWQVTVV